MCAIGFMPESILSEGFLSGEAVLSNNDIGPTYTTYYI